MLSLRQAGVRSGLPHRERNDSVELLNEEEIFDAYLDKAISEANSLATQIEECSGCELSKNSKPLPGAGYPLADFFLLKAQVSQLEHEAGVAFAGASVEVLKKAFERLNVDISHVYGANVIKCYRETGESDKNIIKACLRYLNVEIEICQPRVILAMGLVPCLALKMMGISQKGIDYQPGSIVALRPDLQLVITCDLEQALEEESIKRRFWKDLQRAKGIIDKELVKEQDS